MEKGVLGRGEKRKEREMYIGRRVRVLKHERKKDIYILAKGFVF